LRSFFSENTARLLRRVMANDRKPHVVVLGSVNYLSDEYLESVKDELNIEVCD
jgi:hypothetical protein